MVADGGVLVLGDLAGEELPFVAGGDGHELAHEGDGEVGADVLGQEVEHAQAVVELSGQDEVSDHESAGGGEVAGGIVGA